MLGSDVPVDVFSADEASAFLTGRTGQEMKPGRLRLPPHWGTCRWRWRWLRR